MAAMKYPTEPALEAAVIARADEDTPRLAYADWLDEHGDPVRAEWIRVQCRLADLSPAAPDWFDLRERQEELACLLKHRHLTRVGEKYNRFYFGHQLLNRHDEPFRRGFPYFIDCQTSGGEWTADEVRRVSRDLARLVSETTIRGFHSYDAADEHLTQLLSASVCAQLRGLEISPSFEGGNWCERAGKFYEALGANEHLRGIEHLFLYSVMPEPAVRALTRATVLESVRRLTIGGLSAPAAALTKLGTAAWFRRLRHLRVTLSAAAPGLLVPLSASEELHTLDLPSLPPSAAAKFAAGKWPALARLYFGGALKATGAKALAKAKFPALVEFHNASAARNDDLNELLKGGWVERLRVLNLDGNQIGDAGVKALAAHPVAHELRHLHLGDNTFGKGGLTAIATGFPALTVLDLGSSLKRKATEADTAAFTAALSAPLKHLNLHGWPLGDTGAKALAANPALAGLTRLNVDGCNIGDAGAKTILASPHLRNVVDLRIDGNAYKPAAVNALDDPAVLPNLGECWADGSERLRKTIVTARPRLYLIV
jgi:uncharacterized protein (TIGR02996 family)